MELKNCFCGGEVIGTPDSGGVEIECTLCHYTFYDTSENCVWWQTRPIEESLQKRIDEQHNEYMALQENYTLLGDVVEKSQEENAELRKQYNELLQSCIDLKSLFSEKGLYRFSKADKEKMWMYDEIVVGKPLDVINKHIDNYVEQQR